MALQSNSPDAHVFCLLHKMDLVDAHRRKELYAARSSDLLKRAESVVSSTTSSSATSAKPNPIICFATSIWDETLYRAWSRIVHTLIPNVATLERHLAQFARVCSAAEVVLFEKSTFLVISRSTQQPPPDDSTSSNSIRPSSAHDSAADAADSSAVSEVHGGPVPYSGPNGGASSSSSRDVGGLNGKASDSDGGESAPQKAQLSAERFEKISELIKNLKSSCAKLQAQFQGLEVRGASYTAYLDLLTANTYVMVIVADPRIREWPLPWRSNIIAKPLRWLRPAAHKPTHTRTHRTGRDQAQRRARPRAL